MIPVITQTPVRDLFHWAIFAQDLQDIGGWGVRAIWNISNQNIFSSYHVHMNQKKYFWYKVYLYRSFKV